MSRVAVLVDGFNLYHAMENEPRLHKYKWLDLAMLAKCFIRPSDSLVAVFYFTAYATWNAEKMRRHQDYVRALELNGVRPIMGEFKRKDKYCPLCHRWHQSFEEKQTDVHIALKLFEEAVAAMCTRLRSHGFSVSCYVFWDWPQMSTGFRSLTARRNSKIIKSRCAERRVERFAADGNSVAKLVKIQHTNNVLLSKLNFPPIKEALFDIRVNLPETIKVSDFEAAHERIRPSYPNRKSRSKIEGRIERKEGKSSAVIEREGVDGLLFRSSDEKQIVQFRLDGFTVNRLKPYPGWEIIFPQVKELWTLFKEIAKPNPPTRIAVRYINSLDFPSPSVKLHEYLTILPSLPPSLPENIGEFISRVEVPFENSIQSIITVLSSPPPRPGVSTIILDIDVFKHLKLGRSADDDLIWGIFEQIRQIKNRIFSSCITDNLIGLLNANPN